MVCFSYLNEGDWLGYTYYTAEAVLTLTRTDGTQVNLIAEVDSGAAITLLPRSVANLLGVEWSSGQPIALGGVGGQTFTAYVHMIEAYIGETYVPELPIAIAPTEDFPPLLGRLGLYDVANVAMNNDSASVCVGEITTPMTISAISNTSIVAVLAVLGVIAVVMLTGESK